MGNETIGDPSVGLNGFFPASTVVKVIGPAKLSVHFMVLGLQKSIDRTITEDFDVHCLEPGTLNSVKFINEIMAKDQHTRDPNIGNNKVEKTLTFKCNGIREKVAAELHTIDQTTKGGEPLASVVGAPVRLYDRDDPLFQLTYGGKNPNGSLYPAIFGSDIGRVTPGGTCTTGADGTCEVFEQKAGNYLILVEVVVPYSDGSTKTVIAGKPKSVEERFHDPNGDGAPDPLTDTDGAGIPDTNCEFTIPTATACWTPDQ